MKNVKMGGPLRTFFAPWRADDFSSPAHRRALSWLGFFLAPLAWVFSCSLPVPCSAGEGKLYVLECPLEALLGFGRAGIGDAPDKLRLKAPTPKEIERMKIKVFRDSDLSPAEGSGEIKGGKMILFILEQKSEAKKFDPGTMVLRKPTLEEMEKVEKFSNFPPRRYGSSLEDWEMVIGMGSLLPLGERASAAYGPGFSFCLDIGVKLSENFSVLAGVIGGRQDSIDDALTGGDGHSTGALCLLGKFRVPTPSVRPYLLGGLGVAGDFYPDYDNSTAGTPIWEMSLCLQAGLGLEIPYEPNRYFFLEGRLVSSFISRSFADIGHLDTPSAQVFLQGGILLGR